MRIGLFLREERGHSMKGQKIRLSQCMIVKDEEKNIEKALTWGQGIVTEQIVVDTGSADRTVEIARSMGAKVFSFPWNDDFSAARNYALEQASGDWIAFLDADEYFTEEEAKKLPSLLQQVHSEPKIDVIQIKMLHLDDAGMVISASGQNRIFRKGLRYRYPIHEELFAKGGLNVCDAGEWLTVLHTGYGQETLDSTQKGKRNIRMLEKSLKDYPGNATLLAYLGDSYISAGDEDTAAACYRQVLTKQAQEPGKVKEWAYLRAAFQLMTYLNNQKDPKVQQEIYPICMNLQKNGYSMHPDVDFFLGIWYLQSGKYEKSLLHLESALEKLESYKGSGGTHISGMLDVVYQWLAAIYFERENNPVKAVQYATTALRLNKYAERAVQTLIKAFSTEGGDVSNYLDFLGKIYDYDSQKDILFLYKHARIGGFTALVEGILQKLPEEFRKELEKL